ncbi:MAG: HIT family protein [Gemmataceae bacterium]
MSDSACPFCRKLAGQDPWSAEGVLWEFPHSVAVLGPWQWYHGYCVVVARCHARELFDLPDDTRRAYLDEITLVARAIHTAWQPIKMNYELLGNQVPHLHCHLFPRYAHDPARLAPVWLALDAAERDPARRQQLETGPISRDESARRLREVLTTLGAPRA